MMHSNRSVSGYDPFPIQEKHPGGRKSNDVLSLSNDLIKLNDSRTSHDAFMRSLSLTSSDLVNVRLDMPARNTIKE